MSQNSPHTPNAALQILMTWSLQQIALFLYKKCHLRSEVKSTLCQKPSGAAELQDENKEPRNNTRPLDSIISLTDHQKTIFSQLSSTTWRNKTPNHNTCRRDHISLHKAIFYWVFYSATVQFEEEEEKKKAIRGNRLILCYMRVRQNEGEEKSPIG